MDSSVRLRRSGILAAAVLSCLLSAPVARAEPSATPEPASKMNASTSVYVCKTCKVYYTPAARQTDELQRSNGPQTDAADGSSTRILGREPHQDGLGHHEVS